MSEYRSPQLVTSTLKITLHLQELPKAEQRANKSLQRRVARLRFSDNHHRGWSYGSRRWSIVLLCVSYLYSPRVHASDVTEFRSFESAGTVHKQLTFSEFRGKSYTTEVSDKFTDYLKLCYRA